MTIIKKFNYVKARTFGLLHQPTVPSPDAAQLSFLTTPPPLLRVNPAPHGVECEL